MKPLLFLLLIYTGMMPCLQAQDANALIKQVKAKLATVQDYEAKAILKTDVSFIKVPDSDITVYFKKPDKFKIKKQNGIVIVPKGGVNMNLSSLFTNENYTAVAAGKGTMHQKAVSIVKLLPLDEKSDVVVSTLYIDEQDVLIRKAVITTKNNGTYEMEMGYGKFSKWGLPDKVSFIFNTSDYKLPKGLAFDYDTGKPPVAASSEKNQKGKVEISYTNYSINKGISEDLFQ